MGIAKQNLMSLKDSAPKIYGRLLRNYQSLWQTVPSEKSLVFEGGVGVFSQKGTPMGRDGRGNEMSEKQMRKMRQFERMEQIQAKTQIIVDKLNPYQSK